MSPWSWRRTRTSAPVRERRHTSEALAERVELADIVPDVGTFLGQLAALQLDAFESYARVAAACDDVSLKSSLAAVAGAALDRFDAVRLELLRVTADPVAAMAPFGPELVRFHKLCAAPRWQQDLLAAYLAMGILDDFFVRLSEGLPDGISERVASILDGDDDAPVAILREQIEREPGLDSLLALWGRRLVGDVLLIARSALSASARETMGTRSISEEERIEPVVTEIIAAHTRRMDQLGLTA